MTTIGNIGVLVILFIFFLKISPVQTIACYTCMDCGDPFNAQSSNVSQSAPTCEYCYKLTVYFAYAPTYIIKECVQNCTESGRIFGGTSLQVSCCQSSSFCNQTIGIYTLINRFLLILMLFFLILTFMQDK